MSPGARFFLGGVSILLGAMMIIIAPDDDNRLGFYGFGAFGIGIGLTCFTSGRVQALFGSIVASCVVLSGVSYLVWELSSGSMLSGSRSSPSVLNALRFNAVFSVPAAIYVWKVRFGVGRSTT
ncbi:MAG: hypothetical protein DCF22_07450 [Leptolyngbya sp.]|nr:MAG: hypothetical protein DCF22_07450 [Leptolyngbya sp.]